MARCRANSWQYILRFLPRSCSHVKQFATWLEQYKPLFWLKDAERLTEYVKNRRIKRISNTDIPDTLQPELVAGLVYWLQRINSWYNECHRKAAEHKLKLAVAYATIPESERCLIERIKAMAPLRPWPLEDCPEEELLFTRMDLISFKTLADISDWLKKPERHLWLQETERLAKIVSFGHDKARMELEREQERIRQEFQAKFEKEQRQREQQWKYSFAGLFTSSEYAVLGLPIGADVAAIKKAYRTLAKKYHPDVGGNAEQFKRINEAYHVLLKAN